jgi:hypothetical protein
MIINQLFNQSYGTIGRFYHINFPIHQSIDVVSLLPSTSPITGSLDPTAYSRALAPLLDH